MLNSNLFLFLYILVFLLGTVLATLLCLFSKNLGSALSCRLRNFSVAFLLYSIFEFILYYFVNLNGANSLIIVSMLCSDGAYYIFIVCWALALEAAYADVKSINKKLLIGVTIPCGLIPEFIAVRHAVFEDGAALILTPAGAVGNFLTALNFFYSLLLLCIGIRYCVHSILRWKTEKGNRVLILLSGGLVYYILWIMKWDYLLVARETVRGEDLTLADPIISIYIFVCIAAIYYFYKKNDAILKGDRNKSAEEVASLGNDEIAAKLSAEFGLTKREQEVLLLVYEGMNSAAIGESLFISEYTVKRHLNSIFKKTGCKSRFELLAKRP